MKIVKLYEMLQRVIVGGALFVLCLLILLMHSFKLEVTYIFINEGECHLLPHCQDELTLKENGQVESNNFPRDAVFVREGDFFY